MDIAFRVDAAGLIGTGHFMRCLTLADALLQRGAHIRFVSRGLPRHLHEMLAERGVACMHLNEGEGDVGASGDARDAGCQLAHAAWLGTSQAYDARCTAQALEGQTWDWLIVDHYALDQRWEAAMRGTAHRIMAIDDLADRQHDCDVLLDQNFYQDMDTRYAGKVPAHAQSLLGPRYALLRDAFPQLRDQRVPYTGRVARILVFFGGMDAANYTGAAIQALVGMGLPQLAVDVVIGLQHPQRVAIEAACAVAGFACHVQTTRMAELTAAADLAVCAGGSAVWERCCLGLPTLSLCVADNQRQQIVDAAQAGLLYAPSIDLIVHSDRGDETDRAGLIDLIRRHVSALLESPMLLQHVSRRAMETVDGKGSTRVACVLLGQGAKPMTEAQAIQLRPANQGDAAMVWPWRNAESTRRHFFDPSPIGLDTHLAWWARCLSDSQRALLIAHQAGKPFGVLRFDFDQASQAGQTNGAVVSLYLDPAMIGRGLGRALMLVGLDWLRQNHPRTQTVSAEILVANVASRKVFESVGFTQKHAVFARKV